MAERHTRTERDSVGELRVPAHALYGAQTQRAVENFAISDLRMPRAFIRALGLIKAACAAANRDLGFLSADMAEAIIQAAGAVAAGQYDDQFPVDVFQTGSGTSTNMNANEVLARLASERLGTQVHPNDHINMSQSSNDVIPTALHVSACLLIEEELRPALEHLAYGTASSGSTPPCPGCASSPKAALQWGRGSTPIRHSANRSRSGSRA
jgi:fumarate hydratase class II